jgi:hypothetical protein
VTKTPPSKTSADLASDGQCSWWRIGVATLLSDGSQSRLLLSPWEGREGLEAWWGVQVLCLAQTRHTVSCECLCTVLYSLETCLLILPSYFSYYLYLNLRNQSCNGQTGDWAQIFSFHPVIFSTHLQKRDAPVWPGESVRLKEKRLVFYVQNVRLEKNLESQLRDDKQFQFMWQLLISTGAGGLGSSVWKSLGLHLAQWDSVQWQVIHVCQKHGKN